MSKVKCEFGELFSQISEALEDGRLTMVEVYGIIKLIIKLSKASQDEK